MQRSVAFNDIEGYFYTRQAIKPRSARAPVREHSVMEWLPIWPADLGYFVGHQRVASWRSLALRPGECGAQRLADRSIW